MMPSQKDFRKYMEKLNIGIDDDIVLYDDFSVLGSARVWWTFQNFGKNTVIYNGKTSDWEKAGYELERGEIVGFKRSSPANYNFYYNGNYNISLEEVLKYEKVAEAGKGFLIDARPEVRHLGKVPEPRPNLRSGRIPHSTCLFFKKFLNEDFTMKSPD